jgi:glycolate oxidase FAD binding subunit
MNYDAKLEFVIIFGMAFLTHKMTTIDMNTSTCVLDGFGPLALVRPGSVPELGDLIRAAAASNRALYPIGGQTKISLGMPPTKPGQAVYLRDMAQIVDFPARDMTVTVQTGITIHALRESLARENLRLPIDVAQSHRATLGGILAANSSGPRRYGYGTLRDYVIGISALNDNGIEFKAGGRVVKNVAGYDLCKLLVGSLGTLGIITQATLKLRPLPQQQAVIRLSCESAQVEAMLTCLHESRTRPVSIDLMNQAAVRIVFPKANVDIPDVPWVLLVGYEGNTEAVIWQVQQIVKEVGTQCRLEARVDFTAVPLWDALIELAALSPARTVFKAHLLPSAVAWFCQGVDREPNRPALHALAGNGIVYGHWPSDLTKERAASMLNAWRDLARQAQGGVIVLCCPSDWKAAVNVWGPAPHGAWLMREVKAIFDPRRIFNPGRFVDGI